VEDSADEQALISALERGLKEEKLRFIEIRAACASLAPNSSRLSTNTFSFHKLDLGLSLATLFANCHKSSTQRKILRAEREGLVCETGRSQALLNSFWDLLLITRRRHGVPPQPKRWFRNLIDCFGDSMQIRVAYKEKQPVASILTLRHKQTLMYKYGGSDARFHNLGGTQLLFWRAIEDAKRDGLSVFDLGRTDCENAGLVTFKDRWGSVCSTLSYSRVSLVPSTDGSERLGSQHARRLAKELVSHLPSSVLRLAGSALYRHIA